ncbi:hypothetical protein KIW84_023266 [Lathyrus oleraceus]|uniref:THIF-type NAD/FAD binding fold domain-containing protein n=1 Tax=Pisum sativum TaxID=3888 RepID=A0A9D5B7R6_PEA|nr:hypothetical protein KIW84_023266 [Pisum sativum]
MIHRYNVLDHDKFELNNMHRQIIHTEAYIGQLKVKSAAAACRSINSSIEVVEHEEALQNSKTAPPSNALRSRIQAEIPKLTNNLQTSYSFLKQICSKLQSFLIPSIHNPITQSVSKT